MDESVSSQSGMVFSRVVKPCGQEYYADANANCHSIYDEIAEPRVASRNPLLSEFDRSAEYQ
jgi:hypothetical protein